MNRERVCVRLDAATLFLIDSWTDKNGGNRTKTIERALRSLVHDLQTGRMKFSALKYSPGTTKKQSVQLRLPIIITNYLRINCYSITTAIEDAAIFYLQ